MSSQQASASTTSSLNTIVSEIAPAPPSSSSAAASSSAPPLPDPRPASSSPGTMDARKNLFRELLDSLNERLPEIRLQSQRRELRVSHPDVAKVVLERARNAAGIVPPPAGLALQAVIWMLDFPVQRMENVRKGESLHDRLQDVKRQLESLGSVPYDLEEDMNKITESLVKAATVLEEANRRHGPGIWRKCASCMRALVCAKCDALRLQDVAADLSTALDDIKTTLVQICDRRIERPAVAPQELPPHLVDVGIDGRVSKVMEFLTSPPKDQEISGVRVVGLQGEGGIGKTTLMNAVHNRLADSGAASQHKNIGMVEVDMTRPPPFTQLQERLYSQLSGGTKYGCNTAAQGRAALKQLFADLKSRNKPVCMYLDNVWECEHLEELLPHDLADALPSKSYLVITSRSAEVVRRLGQMCFKSAEEEMLGYWEYKLELLGEEDAVKLFVENASKRRELREDHPLVKAVVPLCGGLPLALAVYGSYFIDERRRKQDEWVRVRKNMQQAQDLPSERKVFQKLKLSVQFQSEELQDAFLDVALFFNRNKRFKFDFEAIKYAMKEENYLDSLVEQSLVRVRRSKEWNSDKGRTEEIDLVEVHDLLVLVARQMAKEKNIAPQHPCQGDLLQVRYFDIRDVRARPEDNYPSISQIKAARYLILPDFKDIREVEFFFTTIAEHCHKVRLLELGMKSLTELQASPGPILPWIASLEDLKVLLISGASSSHLADTLKVLFSV